MDTRLGLAYAANAANQNTYIITILILLPPVYFRVAPVPVALYLGSSDAIPASTGVARQPQRHLTLTSRKPGRHFVNPSSAGKPQARRMHWLGMRNAARNVARRIYREENRTQTTEKGPLVVLRLVYTLCSAAL